MRSTRPVLLLALSLVAAALSGLLGMYLVMTPMLVNVDPVLSRYIVGSIVVMCLLALSLWVANTASKAPPEGGPQIARGWRLLIAWAVVYVLVLGWMVMPVSG
ncbi:MAG: hypothetical protein ACK5MT_11025 [Actinomycetales bacterium]